MSATIPADGRLARCSTTPDHLDNLDHLALAGPDLDLLVAEFAERSGVTPVRGGSHTGLGTANFLVGLGGGAHLEFIRPDPGQPEPAQGLLAI